MPRPAAILIAGPTASGKSALAIALAQKLNGVIINADSMQVYRELRVLSARPSERDEAAVPHALYGHVAGADAYSAGRYARDAAAAIAEARAANRRPIIVGGTGLYFRALLEGLSPIPAVPGDVRTRWREEARRLSPSALHEVLAARDPEMAARLNPADTQRVTRALEVLDATGRSLGDWQAQPGQPVVEEAGCIRLVVQLERDALREKCDQRFDAMMEHGALEEVRALAALNLSTDLPVMRALGVAPLLQLLRGELARDAAIEQAKAETRQYVKRQTTWLRRNMKSWNDIFTQQMKSIDEIIVAFIDS